MHDMTTATGSKVFSVSYGPYGATGAGTGTITYTVEQSITTAATSLNVQGIQGNASTSASATVASVPQNQLIARITGTFYASGTAQLVFVQCQSSAGSLVIRGSSFIKFTKLN